MSVVLTGHHSEMRRRERSPEKGMQSEGASFVFMPHQVGTLPQRLQPLPAVKTQLGPCVKPHPSWGRTASQGSWSPFLGAAFLAETRINGQMKPHEPQGIRFQEKMVWLRVFHCADIYCGLQKRGSRPSGKGLRRGEEEEAEVTLGPQDGKGVETDPFSKNSPALTIFNISLVL